MQVRLGVGGCGIVMHRLGILFIHAYADMEQTPYFLHNNTSEVSLIFATELQACESAVCVRSPAQHCASSASHHTTPLPTAPSPSQPTTSKNGNEPTVKTWFCENRLSLRPCQSRFQMQQVYGVFRPYIIGVEHGMVFLVNSSIFDIYCARANELSVDLLIIHCSRNCVMRTGTMMVVWIGSEQGGINRMGMALRMTAVKSTRFCGWLNGDDRILENKQIN